MSVHTFPYYFPYFTGNMDVPTPIPHCYPTMAEAQASFHLNDPAITNSNRDNWYQSRQFSACDSYFHPSTPHCYLVQSPNHHQPISMANLKHHQPLVLPPPEHTWFSDQFQYHGQLPSPLPPSMLYLVPSSVFGTPNMVNATEEVILQKHEEKIRVLEGRMDQMQDLIAKNLEQSSARFGKTREQISQIEQKLQSSHEELSKKLAEVLQTILNRSRSIEVPENPSTEPIILPYMTNSATVTNLRCSPAGTSWSPYAENQPITGITISNFGSNTTSALCSNKKEIIVANKVFEKSPERNGYIVELKPKPPDECGSPLCIFKLFLAKPVKNDKLLEMLYEEYGERTELAKVYYKAGTTLVRKHLKGNGVIASMELCNNFMFLTAKAIVHCAYNSLWMGNFIQPDWDMFQSTPHCIEFHVASRTISGGAIYVSNSDGKHNFQLIKTLVLPDGSILQYEYYAIPSHDFHFEGPLHDGKTMLKKWNLNKYTGVHNIMDIQKFPFEEVKSQNYRAAFIHDLRSVLEQKKAEEIDEFVVIEYDAPVEPESNTVGLGTKIGVGVAVVVFELIFALGDFLPSESLIDDAVNNIKMSETDKVNLQTRLLQQYKATLNISPQDSTAFEGEVLTLTELGEYTRAASLLEDLIKKKPSDPDAFRLLGEVKYEIQDYEGSAAAYKSSVMMSNSVDFEVLCSLTNALLAAKKTDEAVQILLVFCERLNTAKSQGDSLKVDNRKTEVDPIQVELLLEKAYLDWGHVSDDVSVYDQLISSHLDDFPRFLARARFFAPEKAKVLMGCYSRQRAVQCLEAAIERRVSEELKLELCTTNRVVLLSDVTRIFHKNSLTVTRAEVATREGKTVNTFYVRDASGDPVDTKIIDSICQAIGQTILRVKGHTKELNQVLQEFHTRFLFGGLFKSSSLCNFVLVNYNNQHEALVSDSNDLANYNNDLITFETILRSCSHMVEMEKGENVDEIVLFKFLRIVFDPGGIMILGNLTEINLEDKVPSRNRECNKSHANATCQNISGSMCCQNNSHVSTCHWVCLLSSPNWIS